MSTRRYDMRSFVPLDGLDGPWVELSIDLPFELV